MRAILSEKNIVVVLFVLVLITFAMAQEDSRKMEKAYIGINAAGASTLVSLTPSSPEPIVETPLQHDPSSRQ